jgi:hypothetical protein
MGPTVAGSLCWTRRTSFNPDWRKETLGDQKPCRERTECYGSLPALTVSATVRRISVTKREKPHCVPYLLAILICEIHNLRNYQILRIGEKKYAEHFSLKDKDLFIGVGVNARIILKCIL